MRRVLDGETPTPVHLRDYYVAFHADRECATERLLSRLHTVDGMTSYGRLSAVVCASGAREVLDVGCGDGALLRELLKAEPGLRVSGIDLSAREIERARVRLPADAVGDLIQGDATAIPFADRSFDAVTSHMVFMLIPEIESALREARRVLRPGGTLAFLVGLPQTEATRHAEFLGLLMGWIRELHPRFTPINPADPRVWTHDGIRDLLRAGGFTGSYQFKDFYVESEIGATALWDVLVQRYYVGSLTEEEAALVRARALSWLGGTSLTYREALRIVVVRDR